MAVQTRTIRIMWENDATFLMETRLDDGEWITVAEIDENDFFDDLWENGIKKTCEIYIARELDKIGAEMKA